MKPVYYLGLVALALLYFSNKQYNPFLKNLEIGVAIFFLVICAAYWVYDRIWGNKRK